MKHAPRCRVWSPPPSAFAGFRFPAEVIVVAVCWYHRYGLSYRDVEELLAERGINVDQVTVYRWVQRVTSLLADAARFARHSQDSPPPWPNSLEPSHQRRPNKSLRSPNRQCNGASWNRRGG